MVRAGILSGEDATPVMGDFQDPVAGDGEVLIHMDTIALGGQDVLRRYMLPIDWPCVVRAEGVGRAEDGRRLYFGEHSVPPFGAWAERTIVPVEEAWEVPDDVSDRLAITLGISGTGALLPLKAAHIHDGDQALILGATGALGQIGLQLARRMGAGRVVAASRNERALRRLVEGGIADAYVVMGAGDDVAALKAQAGDGFDVVLDLIYGEQFTAALKATRWGARVVTIGVQNSMVVPQHIGDLLNRWHTCQGTGQNPPEVRRQAWLELIGMAREQPLDVLDYREFGFDQVAEAWDAMRQGPHGKVVATISR